MSVPRGGRGCGVAYGELSCFPLMARGCGVAWGELFQFPGESDVLDLALRGVNCFITREGEAVVLLGVNCFSSPGRARLWRCLR